MPRNRRFIRKPGHFHVGARTNNQEWFGLPKPELWPLTTDLLGFTARAFNLRVNSFVLMGNHYHLLVEAPDANLPEAMNYFQRELSRSLNRTLDRTNHIFGGPFFASLIQDDRYLQAVYRYIYRNPIEAGMGFRVQDYLYSTLRMQLGKESCFVPVHDPLGLTATPSEILEWLNRGYADPEQKECIRRGLRSVEFQWKTGKSRRNCWTEDLVLRPTQRDT